MNPNGKEKALVVNDVLGRRLIFGSLYGFVCDGNDVNIGRRLVFGSVSGYIGGKHSEIMGCSISCDGNDPTPSAYVSGQNEEVVDGGERLESLSGLLASRMNGGEEVVNEGVGTFDQ
ncbi:hypothetical protein L6452_40420 [Arctium lappa]|uniref:Uncharacterized protein n=1 Tax=Arctium lappa TaxID=4217 RepID=A0ACB8XM85_ARCLA|nr:hypothetical protein L6452_40420 [Arctium lappa]